MEEVYAVWNRLRVNHVIQQVHNNISRITALKRATPPKSGSSTEGSPLNNWHTRTSFGSQGSSPLKWSLGRGDFVAPINWPGNTDNVRVSFLYEGEKIALKSCLFLLIIEETKVAT